MQSEAAPTGYYYQSPWGWQFRSEVELKSGLEEYTEYQTAQGGPPAGGDPDPDKMDRNYRIWAQNREIDRRMRKIRFDDTDSWALLNSYYRGGQWFERKGWIESLKALPSARIPKCPGPVRCLVPGDNRLDLKSCQVGKHCPHDRDKFEVRLTVAIAVLFAAGEVRSEGTPTAGG